MTSIKNLKSRIKNPSCRFVTLGCKVNQYDTQLVREAMLDAGYREAASEEPADVCVVNTCTVTEHADADGRYEIRRLLRRNPGTKIVVMGCYAARDPEQVRKLPGVALVVEHPSHLRERLAELGIERLPSGISRFAGHHRAFVKVQDGCILNCAFCIIPQVRPRLASRPADEIEAEVRRLIAAGFHEVVLSGIHLGHYGLEWSRNRRRSQWCRLSGLVRRLARIPGDWRLRLSSLEATEVSEELLDTIAQEPRVCPHLHVCLQSGSDRVLWAMNRRYRVAGFLRRIDEIRQRLDQPAVTTDVIVGFPGETDREFEETVNVCETARFSKIHIFPFSPRKGTSAALLTAQLDSSLIRDRKCRLQALESSLAERYHQSLVGRELHVLVEHVQRGVDRWARGTSCRYVPVEFTDSTADEFQLIRLLVTTAKATHVIGRRIEHRSNNEWPSLTVLNEAIGCEADANSKGADND
jgi:threonylcarbamoyladenosine tRNA methylthiotransferase MtaB